MSSVKLELTSVTQKPGWCENGRFASGSQTDDDFSFDPANNLRIITVLPQEETNHGNTRRIVSDKTRLKLFCKDTGAKCTLKVTAYDKDNTQIATATVSIPLDENNNGIADVWERDKIKEYNDLYNAFIPSPLAWASGFDAFTANGGDNEPAELGWVRDPFPFIPTGVPLAHADTGDGLTVHQEYRGYVVDGGATFTSTRHIRLSPARKELLVQVNMQDNIITDIGTGNAINLNINWNQFDKTATMQKVAQFYCDYDFGAGIDLYWVNRQFVPLSTQQPIMGRTNGYRYTGDMFYTPAPGGNITDGSAWISADWEYRKLFGKPAHDLVFPTHNGMFALMMGENRDMGLSGFVMLLMTSRHAHIEGIGYPAPEDPPYTTRPQLTNAFTIIDDNEQFYTQRQLGSVVNLAGLAEEAPFAYLESHYSDYGFKQILAWAIAHEIAHLLRCADNPTASGNLMGPRCFISACTMSSAEISQINLKMRRGVTP